MKNLWAKYCHNTQGNFAIMFSVVVGVLIFAIAIVIETSRMQQAKGVLQDMADTAAISGAQVARIDPENREEVVRESISYHQEFIPDYNLAKNTIVKFDDDAEEVEVSVAIPRKFESFFGKVLGQDELVVSAKSVVSYQTELDPLSIMFALDVSGSMGGNTSSGATKITVLKQSTKLLFDELEENAARPELLQSSIRTGMSAYNTEVVSTENMAWGWSHLENSVDSLTAGGGTNSTPALQNAYDQLVYDRSVRKSQNPKFKIEDLREYVVFMTDGDNNQIIWDAESAQLCFTMRSEGINIYSIAFAAPEKGQLLLLDCASWNNGVEPEGGDDDDDDFDDDDDNKCMNNGIQETGQAFGHCMDKEKIEKEKSEFYFDADDATAFKAAFAKIGKEIAKDNIRVKS